MSFFQKEKKKRQFPIDGALLWHQETMWRWYNADKIQLFVAALIFLNFFVAIVNSQTTPAKESHQANLFTGFEWFFGVIFAIELLINLYGSWFRHFWKSGWNWFDFIIVGISLIALAIDNLPGISVLRLFRAFRVFRLFKRIPSLKNIIEGVFASLPGVANAFVVLTILMGIWSIMGVEFFREVANEEFGTFIKAMFSMWQVMTMDSWASEIGRGIIYRNGIPLASLYFISYLFVAGIVMTNVIVAILLENYLTATTNAQLEMDREQEMQEEERANKQDGKVEVRQGTRPHLTDITKDKLIELVSEVLTESRVNKLEKKEVMELLSAINATPSGRKKLCDKFESYKGLGGEENHVSFPLKHDDNNKIPMNRIDNSHHTLHEEQPSDATG